MANTNEFGFENRQGVFKSNKIKSNGLFHMAAINAGLMRE